MPLTRDFAFLVPGDLPADALVRAMKGADKALVTEVRVFDRYEGDAGLSLAVEVTIQPVDKTLTDGQIAELSKKLVAAAEKLGASLRG
jgi:phenylalanyl-tRNA synthetase beta chain